MKKNIIILGSNNNIGSKAIDYFLEHENKFLIYGLSFDSKTKNIDKFILQVKKLEPKRVYVLNKSDFDYIESKIDNYSIELFYGEDKFLDFIKVPEIDEIVSALSGISSVKKILSAIYEFKDITLLNTSPLLYCGRIIVNEVRSKGVNLKIFSYPLYSLDFLSKLNKLENVYKIALFSKKSDQKEKLDISDYKDNLSYLKKFYSLNRIRLVNDMFLINYLYNVDSTQFSFYEQSKKLINIDVKFNNGTSIIFAANLNINSIFNYYYLNNSNNLEKDVFNEKDIINISFSKLDLNKEKFLELGIYSLNRGGSVPIIYYITIELLLNLIYNREIKQNINIYAILKEFIEDKSLYSKYPDLSSVCSIEEKIKLEILKKYSIKKKTN